MLWNSPQLTLASIGLALLPLLASILTGTRMAQAEKRISDENEIYTSTLADSLGGFSVIKSFQAEAQMLRLFKEHLKKLADAQCHRQKMQILVQAFASVAGITAQLGIFIFGAYLAVSGKGITAGTHIDFCAAHELYSGTNSNHPDLYGELESREGLGGKDCRLAERQRS